MARRRGCKNNIFLQNNPSPDSVGSSLYTREPFLFAYDLSIFLTSTAFVDTNAKARHTSFEICRAFEKLSFRVTLYRDALFVTDSLAYSAASSVFFFAAVFLAGFVSSAAASTFSVASASTSATIAISAASPLRVPSFRIRVYPPLRFA